MLLSTYNNARPSRSINFAQWQILKKLQKRTTSFVPVSDFWNLLSNISFFRKGLKIVQFAEWFVHFCVKKVSLETWANKCSWPRFSLGLFSVYRIVENLLLWFSGSENQVKMQVDTNGFVTISSSQIITLILSGILMNNMLNFSFSFFFQVRNKDWKNWPKMKFLLLSSLVSLCFFSASYEIFLAFPLRLSYHDHFVLILTPALKCPWHFQS